MRKPETKAHLSAQQDLPTQSVQLNQTPQKHANKNQPTRLFTHRKKATSSWQRELSARNGVSQSIK
ncbi:MAG: hypothetical protein ABIK07_08355, partial [Planctomycetota bacterium]